MNIDKVSIGRNPPHDVNVIVEVSLLSPPVKYEMDKESGAMVVDRFLHTAMHYPCNYGFVPHTLSEDGDPVDVLLLGRLPVIPGAVVRAKPVGVLRMEDEKGMDEKLLCVPHETLKSYYSTVQDYTDVDALDRERLEHFFAHYKDLEKGKWVKILGWGDRDEAKQVLMEAIARHDAAKSA
ncbi:inorganic pyrophosphatase [uncultured Alphaproteobacteria bacterium]|uniref:Inorganic pyrophosphatase n=1 Tax=uncultured Alphaproteobacteria bacterium TaxID=91750 RepID=A0A212KAY2_9PROT|nr:inorganic pyrophosphatase [uncultured Alphaproteobacteria bacterium]